jgi:hypothetical protein
MSVSEFISREDKRQLKKEPGSQRLAYYSPSIAGIKRFRDVLVNYHKRGGWRDRQHQDS